MDYEKEYKSLVAKVKKAHQFAQTDSTKSVLEDILPQLRESEDERVRMELIEYLRGDLDDITTDDTDRWISWLEKQKDAFENGRQLGIMQEQARQELEWTDEKQKEQKPAEWSEEDDWKRKELIQYLEEKGDYRTAWMTWLKSLRPQPKQEWSEKDETIIEGACNALEIHGHTKLASMLKSLRPSWKPNEEEKGILLECASVLQNSGHWVLADKLLSLHLQSHWKPSEEQMKHLERCFSHGYTSQLPNQHVLESLYNELKKLM